MSTTGPRRRLAATAAACGLVAASLCFSLLLVELALTLFGYEYNPLQIEASQDIDWRGYHLFEDRHFVYDPDVIWRPRPGVDVFNTQGLRGPTLEPVKPSGAYRIVAVGDSNTLGFRGADGANWPDELQAMLQRSHHDVTVVNAGVWGYSSFQGVGRLREVLAYEPDLVLVSFGANDAHRVRQSDRAYVERRMRQDAWARRLGGFRIGQLLLSALDGLSAGDDRPLEPRVSLEEYRTNLHRMVESARTHGADVALLTRPYHGPVSNPLAWKNFAADYLVATLEVAEDAGAALIDLHTPFVGHDELFIDESHFTEDGYRLAAEIILERIRPMLLRQANPAPDALPSAPR